MIPRVILFDVDNTLTESKQPVTPVMAGLLAQLLATTKVGIVGGGKFEQFKTQLVEHIPADADFGNLYLLPTSGSALYVYEDGAWKTVYKEELSEADAHTIAQLLEEAGAQTGAVDFSAPSHGERIEFRSSQVTLSALGQQAPIDEKNAWDPEQAKRRAIIALIAPKLPDFDLKIGGTTSIDVTKHGINKAYGVRKLSEYLRIPVSDMLYIGDALFPGGNDEVVKETGIKTQQVQNPDDTAEVIKGLLG